MATMESVDTFDTVDTVIDDLDKARLRDIECRVAAIESGISSIETMLGSLVDMTSFMLLRRMVRSKAERGSRVAHMFCKDYIRPAIDAVTKAPEIHSAFREYCAVSGIKHAPISHLKRHLCTQYGAKFSGDGRDGMYWGVAFRFK